MSKDKVTNITKESEIKYIESKDCRNIISEIGEEIYAPYNIIKGLRSAREELYKAIERIEVKIDEAYKSLPKNLGEKND